MFKAFVKRFVISKLPFSVVLMYHRISHVERDYYGICVEPWNFEEQMMVVKKFVCDINNIFSLRPKGKVAITFDDGYKDNFEIAKNILERNDIPATFFITTGFLGKKKTFWDELTELFQYNIKTKCIYLKQKNMNIIITQEDELTKIDPDLYNRFKRIISGNTLILKELHLRKSEFFVLAYVLLKYSQEPWLELENLKNFFEVKNKDSAEGDVPLFMDEKDLVELSSNKNFILGAHTETHRVLSVLNEKEQENEILTSKKKLQEITGKKVLHFAYPFGLEGDFSEKTEEICEKYFKFSFSGTKGVCTFLTPRHRIPRFYVPNCNGEQFERKIFEFFAFFSKYFSLL